MDDPSIVTILDSRIFPPLSIIVATAHNGATEAPSVITMSSPAATSVLPGSRRQTAGALSDFASRLTFTRLYSFSALTTLPRLSVFSEYARRTYNPSSSVGNSISSPETHLPVFKIFPEIPLKSKPISDLTCLLYLSRTSSAKKALSSVTIPCEALDSFRSVRSKSPSVPLISWTSSLITLLTLTAVSNSLVSPVSSFTVTLIEYLP